MAKGARRLLTQCLGIGLGLGMVFWALPSSADPLAGLTPLDPSTLNSAVTNNFNNSLISVQTSSNSGKISDTKISVGAGGQLTNGQITNNTVSNNQGLTSVMMNTGNNVIFNNAFIVNITMPSLTPAH
jgi:MFS-type transporter involved in bile tolerance (Atg22 family)